MRRTLLNGYKVGEGILLHKADWVSKTAYGDQIKVSGKQVSGFRLRINRNLTPTPETKELCWLPTLRDELFHLREYFFIALR